MVQTKARVNSCSQWPVTEAIEVYVNHLMAAMVFESGESFSLAIKNAAGSGARGFIQFIPRTAQDLGTTTAELAKTIVCSLFCMIGLEWNARCKLTDTLLCQMNCLRVSVSASGRGRIVSVQ